jgi:hypothetical protein
MTVDELVQATVERLKGKITGYQVEAFPDEPKKYRFIHPNGALLVRYAGSSYPESGFRTLGSIVVQERIVSFEVRVLSRRLTGPLGAGAYLDAARVALTGWAPPDCKKAYPVDEEFDTYNDKELTWQHHIFFEAQALNVEVAEEEQGPILTALTLTGEDGNETTLEVP